MTSFDFVDTSFGGEARSERDRGQQAKDQSLGDRECMHFGESVGTTDQQLK
jgi:hypothetical protein